MGIINKLIKKQPNVIKRLYYNIIPFNYRYGNVFNETKKFLEETDKWSYEDTKNFQFEKLKHLLKYCKKNVPYYDKLFADYEFNVNINSFNDIKKLPVLTKNIIRQNFDDLISKNYIGKKIKFKTSGSTGAKFEFYGDDSMYKKEAAYILHSYQSHNGNLYDDWSIWIRRYSPEDSNKLFFKDYELKRIYLSAFHINDETIKYYVDLINQTKSKTISTYPSTAFWLSCLLDKYNLKLKHIKAIHGASEKCLDDWNDKIKKVFGFGIKMHYGLIEKVSFMYQSSNSDLYHEDLTYSYNEFSETNTIIGTSFLNYVMPFIRYQTNDIVTLNKNVIYDTSRPLTVKDIDGRTDDMIVAENNSRIPSVNFYTMMYKIDCITMFKLYQKIDKTIELDLIVNNMYNNNINNELITQIKKRVGDLPIKINLVDEIKRDINTGKLRCVISEIK